MTKVQAAANRLQAMLSGDYVYVGRDCKQLHGGMRRTACKHCVQCDIDRLRVRRERSE